MSHTLLTALSWAAALSYLAALGLLWQYTTNANKHTASRRSGIIVLSIIGLILHIVQLYAGVINNQAFDASQHNHFQFSLGHSISLVAVFVTFIFILLSMVRATLNLGLAILPTTILGLIAGLWLNPGTNPSMPNVSLKGANISAVGFEWHLALGIITFSLLTLAFAQSLLILVQEKQLRNHRTLQAPIKSVSFISLPALQSMETLLFQILWLGFAVLSLTLIFGIYTNAQHTGSALIFNHHIVLTLATWLGYAILLIGRHFWGWRGRQASIYTIICYSLFLLGYFGPRIVRELIIT
ncbi:MAG: cytochrome c biogenesis protein CcsA [Arenicellales bacterium]